MPDRKGFTLIELLVSLAIGGVVVSSVLQLLAGHRRFVETQSAREELQQLSRAAIEMIGGDLRGIGPGGLVRATRDSITVRVPRAWGVICEAAEGSQLDVAFPSVPGIDFGVNLGLGVTVFPGLGARAEWLAGVTNVGAPEGECGGVSLAGGVDRRTLTLDRSVPAEPAAPFRHGDVVSLHETVSYRASDSGNVAGRWIQRRIGDGVAASYQPLAGPIAAGSDGLSFEYFAGSGAVPISAPIGDAEMRASVERIRVIAGFTAGGAAPGTPLGKVDTVLISLLNRRCAPCDGVVEVRDE